MKQKRKIWKPDGYIFAALRKIWRWSPERRKALMEAGNDEQGYTCSSDRKPYKREDVAVDHVLPVVDPRKGFQGWDIYIRRLYTSAQDLQVLCKSCHKAKTKEENAQRRLIRKGPKCL